jgi:hypothetical protein
MGKGRIFGEYKTKFELLVTKRGTEADEIYSKGRELTIGFTAKLEQVDLLLSLIFNREDRILVAKTGYEKSVVPHLLPLLTRSSSYVVIILLPLNALGAEQQLADIQN